MGKAGRGLGSGAAFFCGILLAASPVPSARAEEEAASTGPSCRIVGHGVGRPTLDACRDALEAGKPMLDEVLPWPQPADTPLVVHVYAGTEEFAAAMTAAGAPELVDNFAATLFSNHESHVVFSPRSDEIVREHSGPAPDYTVWQVVHEAVHQRISRVGLATYEWWPSWLEEGLCEWLAERVVAARQPRGRVAFPADDRAHLVRDALLEGRFLGLERLLHARVQQFRPERVAYAHAWSFVRMLSEDRARLRALLGRFGGLGGPAGSALERQRALEPLAAAALVDVYGPLPALEARWKDAIRRYTPAWFESTRAGQWLADDRLLATAFPDGGSQLICATPPTGPYVLRTTVRILPLGKKQADVFLAFERRADARFLKVAMGAEGYVTLLAFAAGCWQDRYRVSVDVPKSTFPPDADVPVAVHVDAKRVRVEVGGKPALEADVPPGFDALHGGWGVGAWDTAVVWGLPRATAAK